MSVKEAIEENGDTLTSMLTEMQQASRHSTIPDTATPFSATNATVITTTTLQVIKAAVASKRHWITETIAVNSTPAEDQVLALQDEDDVIAAVLMPADGSLGANAGKTTHNPPLVIASGKAIEGIGKIAVVGDCFITVNGYVEA